MTKLAIVASHPIQYYAPWFCHLAQHNNLDIKVFYLWDFGITQQIDPGFKQSIQWDLPLLEGYESEFVPNASSRPGTDRFWGLNNPTLSQRVQAFLPDAVLLMNYNYASCYRFLLQWNRDRIPLLFRGDSHRLLPSPGIKAWAKQKVIQKIFHRFAACLYVGKANYEYFRYHDVSANRLFFSPHAVDNDRFFDRAAGARQEAIAWKKSLGVPENHAVILFAGKFETKKRPLDLLRAFQKAALDNVSLLFVGAGPLEETLKAETSIHDSIYFAPFQNQTLMPRTYAAADLVVLPSYSNQETWGLAINEAMCLSCPVIVSNHVGCAQDLVHPMENGLVFPAGDVEALTTALKEAFSDRDRLRQWGIASRTIVSNYSYARATEGLLQALNCVCHP
ncbi:glycosyltransferase family 4 protein [Altericista sp. CCNU0014]|uniref:glycosyltransferase family 4 protein n=1 Tax=Altericista sp. CCNU0014 TaxID=3082949 RepID=UPI0038514507